MNRFKRGLAVVLAAVCVLGTAACGRTKVSLENYGTTVVATLGDTNIYLDEANFLARTNQYSSELYYTMYGYSTTDMWTGDLGTGKTLGEYTKESVMRSICQTYVLKAKAEELGLSLDEDDLKKVDEAVTQTVGGMAEELREAVGDISEERIREIIVSLTQIWIKTYWNMHGIKGWTADAAPIIWDACIMEGITGKKA